VLEAAIAFADKQRGLLAIGVRTETANVESLRRQLEDWAGCLGLCLAFEEEHCERERLANQHLEERFLADVGQISRPVVHELYNLLNTLSLQVEVLKMKFPGDSMNAELAMVKKQVTAMVKVLKAFRSYRQKEAAPVQSFDFHRLVRDTVAALQREARLPDNVECDLASGSVQVRGSAVDARRLLRFLMVNAEPGAALRIRSASSAGKLVLTVEGIHANPAAELHQAFEGHADGGLCAALELAAFKMLLESFHGRVAAEPLEEGRGQRAVVEVKTVETT
jgi:hypothetical protein